MTKTKSANKIKNYILASVCGIFAIASVLMTIEAGASGVEVSKIESQLSALTEQKQLLEENLVKGVSVAELQEKSGDLGFAKPTNLVYVTTVEPVAKLP